MQSSNVGAAGASSKAIQKHYDVGDDFYRLWLDEKMIYSCAMWRDAAEPLEVAQERKMDWIGGYVSEVNAKHVLDIGCGWGGLIEHLQRKHGVSSAVGLTLSQTQQQHVQSLKLPGTIVRLQSWSDHVPESLYDAVISVGAFEHFAKPEMSSSEKVEAYRLFFSFCRDASSSSAPLILQTIYYGSSNISTEEGRRFFAEVFPESDCPRLPEIVAAAEGIYDMKLMRNDGTDYTLTLNRWLRKLRRCEDEAEKLVGREVVEFYKQYLRISSIGFHTRRRGLLRSVWLPV